jgi:cytochrome P450
MTNAPQFLEQQQRRHGQLFRARLMGQQSIRIHKPECAELVCKNSKDTIGHTALSEFDQLRLKTISTEKFQRFQAVLNQVVNQTFLQESHTKIRVFSAELVEELQDLESINVYRYFYEQLLYFVLSLFFGVDCRKNFGQKIQQALQTANALTPFITYRERSRSLLHKELQKIIKHALQTSAIQNQKSLALQIVHRLNKSTLTEQQPADYLARCVVTMHQQASSAITSSLYWLAKHPDWREKIQQDDTSFVAESVVKESIRLFPPVISIAKQLQCDVVLGNYALPAQTLTGISIYHLHRDPDYWSNPHEFHPERFFTAEPGQHPYQFIPFGNNTLNTAETALPLLISSLVLDEICAQLTLRLLNKKPIVFTAEPAWRPKGKLQLQFLSWDQEDD